MDSGPPWPSPCGRRRQSAPASQIAPSDLVELPRVRPRTLLRAIKIGPADGSYFDRANGGEGEIRTHEPRKGPPVFKTGAFNHSATSPVSFNLT